MNTREASREKRAFDATRESIAGFLSICLQRRRLLIVTTGVGLFLGMGIAWLIPDQYTSTAQLMPPEAPSPMSALMQSGLNSTSPSVTPSLGGALMGTRTLGGTFIGILNSRTTQDDIINRLDLRHAYHCKYYFEARKKLADRTTVKEDKKSGIISVAVIDRDRYRARDIAGAYVEELDKLLNAKSTSSAHLERVFLEGRIKSLKDTLDAAASELSVFSSRNATLNPQTQGQSLIEAAAKLQGELIMAQSELNGLRTRYSDDNVRVREVRARINELQNQLRKMDGTGEKESAQLKADRMYPSIRELPILGVTYSNLARQLTVQEDIYESLTKQYEIAKVQEAKEIPTVKVLDEPDLPETKSFPHRVIIVALCTLLAVSSAIVWICFPRLWGASRDAASSRPA